MESDADLVAATALQAKTFSLAAAQNRIGRGPRRRYEHCTRAILRCRNGPTQAELFYFGKRLRDYMSAL